jgi:tetratricopeptide (TPR) repeat protein
MIPFLVLNGNDAELKFAESARWSMIPSEWRAAQRSKQWDTVVFSGPLTEYRPLLNHLLISPDWRLTGFTNQGWVFKRGEGVPVVLPAADSIDLGSATETALYLAQLSARFEAMGNAVAARASIERALELAPREAEVRMHAANFAAARKRWQDVAAHAKAALKSSPGSATGHSLLALAMLESGDPGAARKSAQEALRLAPADPGTLFLLARAQRTEKDYRSEAETLEILVATCRDRGLPSAGYQAYLAQAYAQVGNAEGAAKNYREALSSGQLDEVQAGAIREALEVVESHVLPGSQRP